MRDILRPLLRVAAAALIACGLATPADAQYFGRNRVRYDDFSFQILETQHFRIH